MDLKKKKGPQRLIREQPTFRAPIWTTDGRSLIYSTPRNETESTLWRWNRDRDESNAIAELSGAAALLRAPATDLIAMTTIDNDGPGGSQLQILDLTTDQPTTPDLIQHGPVIASFWAPDASALFYLSSLLPEADLELVRYDRATRTHQRLARFRPSAEYATLLALYDQFAQSHAVVSPDGRWITFAGIAANNGSAGAHGIGPQNGCYVVPTNGSAPARRVAAGDLGFFPPLPQPKPEPDSEDD